MNDIKESSEISINDRLVIMLNEVFDGNVSEFARKSGIPQPTLNNIVGNRRSKPSFENLVRLTNSIETISAEWLLRGKGSMIKKEGEEKMTVQTLPRIPYTAVAGTLGTIALDGVTNGHCEQVPVVKSFPKYNFSIFIKGDSMEPDYCAGDEVACLALADTKFVQWGKVHVLDTTQGIVVKRIYDAGESIRCNSRNPDYPDFLIPKDEIYSMSLVVGLLRL